MKKRKIWKRRRDGVKQRYTVGRKTKKNYGMVDVTLFHGTKKRLVPKIMEEGLKPISTDETGKKAVFLTKHPKVAKGHARSGPEREATDRLNKLLKEMPQIKSLEPEEKAKLLNKTWHEESEPAVLKIIIDDKELTESPIDKAYEILSRKTIHPEKIQLLTKEEYQKEQKKIQQAAYLKRPEVRDKWNRIRRERTKTDSEYRRKSIERAKKYRKKTKGETDDYWNAFRQIKYDVDPVYRQSEIMRITKKGGTKK